MKTQTVLVSEIATPTFKYQKDARKYVGGLGKASKMLGLTYGLSASICKVGGKLKKIKGSTCEFCYADDRGRYAGPIVKQAHANRLASLYKSGWVNAMSKAIETQSYFRWHDSGDLLGMLHLKNIVQVARNTPQVKHWIPTREKALIRRFLKTDTFPPNLCVRISAAMIDGAAPTLAGVQTSTVHIAKAAIGHACPVSESTLKTCASAGCDACWNTSIQNISYREHVKNKLK